MKKQIILPVIAISFMAIGCSGGISKTDYDAAVSEAAQYGQENTDLQSKAVLLTDENAKLKEALTSASSEYEKINEEYAKYKESMQEYEGLAAVEADSKKIIAESIVAEKKAEEESESAAKKAAQEQAAAEEQARKDAKAKETTEQRNALNTAGSYLSYSPFSYRGLIDQLIYEGYSKEASTYAADNCGADWNKQAEKQAESYIEYSSFSRSGLIDQLVYEGFTREQAEHGVSAVGY